MKENFTYDQLTCPTATALVGLSHRGSRVETHAAAANRKIRRREASQCGQPYGGHNLDPLTGLKKGNKIVIGRNMRDRVNPIANDINGETITESWNNATNDNFHGDMLAGKQFNKHWIDVKIEENYYIYDIGPVNNNDIGINYGMELRKINQYENVFQMRLIIHTKHIRVIKY